MPVYTREIAPFSQSIQSIILHQGSPLIIVQSLLHLRFGVPNQKLAFATSELMARHEKRLVYTYAYLNYSPDGKNRYMPYRYLLYAYKLP
jgi:hypothetical protein